MAWTFGEPGKLFGGPGTFGSISTDPIYATARGASGFILLAELFFEGGYYVQRIATDWWYSQPGDSIGVQEWQGRITSEPTYSVQLGCIHWGSKTTVSIGSIEIADPAGELDWMQRKTRDALCVLRLAIPGQSYDETQVIGRAIVDSVEMTGDAKVVNLRGMDTLLDRPLQTTTYAAGNSSATSDPSTSGPPPNDATASAVIEGQKIPVVIGRVWQHEPILIDTQNLVFQITDAGIKDVEAVLSGGSVADPPDSSGEDWDYAYLRTSFQMSITPSARITANCGGIRALASVPAVADRFDRSTSWSSDGPASWSISASSGTEVSQVELVGLAMLADAGESSGPSVSRSVALAADSWAVVLIDVCDLRDGYLIVSTGSPVEIRREGRHAIITTMDSAGQLSIEVVPDAQGADITIASVFVYALEDSTGTDGLVEMMRHVTIARGALPDAEVTPVDIISTSSGDFDSSGDLDGLSISTNAQASVGVAGGELSIVCGNLAAFGSALVAWPNTLEAGERYTLAADIDVTAVLGAVGPTAAYAYFRFDPASGLGSSFINIASLNVATVGASTVAGAFEPTEPGILRLIVGAGPASKIEFSIDNLRLVRLDFADDGATVDFDSLRAIDDGYQFGMVGGGAETVREVAGRLMDSIAGWVYPDPAGRIRFGRLQTPSGPSVMTLSRVNLLGKPVYVPDLAPGLSDTWSGGRNWSPYSDSELAGITYPNRPPFRADYRAKRRGSSADSYARPYTHAIGAESIGTYIYDGDDVQAESDRQSAIYAEQQGFWVAEVALESAEAASAIRPDMVVTLDDPMFADDNGKIATIVGVDGRYRGQVLKLTLWGATNA